MRSRYISVLMAFVMLILLAGESPPVFGIQPEMSIETVDTGTNSVANAPWVKMELDTAQDTGHHVSVAIDAIFGGVYVSY